MNILWLGGGAEESVFGSRLALSMCEKLGAKAFFVTAFAESARRLRESGIDCKSISDHLKENGLLAGDDAALFARAESALGEYDVSQLVHGDPLLSLFFSKADAQRFSAAVAVFFADFIRKNNISCCVRYITGNSVGRALAVVSEHLKVPCFVICSGAGFDACGVMVAGRDEQWRWREFDRRVDTWRQAQLSAEDRNGVDAFVKAYWEKHQARPRTRWEQNQGTGRSTAGSVSFPHRCLDALGLQRKPVPVQQEIPRTDDLEKAFEFWTKRDNALEVSGVQAHERFAYDEVPERFVYFPLNFPWDCNHRAWNPMNYLQEYIAEIAHESLPRGVELIVKQHPYSLNEPTYADLTKLQRMGVKVVRPQEHSLALIKKAEAVFCLGDTSGWEAILFRVPVIVFAERPFYCESPGVRQISAPNDVPAAMRWATRDGRRELQDDETWYRFVHMSLASSQSGNPFGYKRQLWTDADKSDGNLASISSLLLAEVSAHFAAAVTGREQTSGAL